MHIKKTKRLVSLTLVFMLVFCLVVPSTIAAESGSVIKSNFGSSNKDINNVYKVADTYLDADAVEGIFGLTPSQQQLDALISLRVAGRTGGLVGFEDEYDLDNLSGMTRIIVEFVNQPAEVAMAEAALSSKNLDQSLARKLAKSDHEKFAQALSDMFASASSKKSVSTASYAITTEYHDAINGVAAQVPASAIADIAALDMVFAVYPDILVSLDDETNPVTEETVTDQVGLLEGRVAMKADELHAMGIKGAGITVGVIDTGVDYNHPDIAPAYLGGRNYIEFTPEYEYNYTAPRSAATHPLDPMETTYADWLASEPLQPEFNADDDVFYTSHGTHVSSTIVGRGVNTPISALGIAPEAMLRAYRVLGPYGEGWSNWIVSAIEDSAKDGCDVVNLSLGASNANDPYYVTSVAINNITLTYDVLFSCSAGNSGPSTFKIGSPGTSTLAMSVGWALAEVPNQTLDVEASDGSRYDFRGFYHTWDTAVTPNDLGTYTISYTNEYESSLTMTEDGKYKVVGLADANGDLLTGVEADWEAADLDAIKGNFVMVYRGATFTETMKYACQYGAGGLIIVHHGNSDYGTMNYRGAESEDALPFYSLDKDAGLALWNLVKQNGYISVKGLKSIPGGEMNSQSSRGPVRRTYDIKPDLVSHGDSVLAAYPYYMFKANRESGSYEYAYSRISGTSMSSPHAAGAAALLRSYSKADELGWSAAEVKARLMHSADDLDIGYSVYEVGTGFINVKKALELDYYVTVDVDAPTSDTGGYDLKPGKISTLNFGNALSGEASSKTITATVNNGSAAAVTLPVSVAFNTEGQYVDVKSNSGVTLTPSVSTIEVPAGGTATIDFTMSIPDTLGESDLGSYEGYVSIGDARMAFALWLESGVAAEPCEAYLDRTIIAAPNAPNRQITGYELEYSSMPFPEYQGHTYTLSSASDIWFTAGDAYDFVSLFLVDSSLNLLGYFNHGYGNFSKGETYRMINGVRGYYSTFEDEILPFNEGLYFIFITAEIADEIVSSTLVPLYVDNTAPTLNIDGLTEDGILYYEGDSVDITGTLYDEGFNTAAAMGLDNYWFNTYDWGWAPDSTAVFARLDDQYAGGYLDYDTDFEFGFTVDIYEPGSSFELELFGIDYFHPSIVTATHGVTAVDGIDLTRPSMRDDFYLWYMGLTNAGFYGPNMESVTIQIKPKTVDPEPTPLDVSVSTSSIYSSLSAYLNVTVGGAEEGAELIAYFGDYQAPVVDGQARIYVESAPEAGDYKIYVQDAGVTMYGECDVTVVQYNKSIWHAYAVRSGGNERTLGVYFHDSVKVISVGSLEYNGVIYNDFTIIDNVVSTVIDWYATSGTATLKKVKIDLFPSYTFTFKAETVN